MEKWNEINGRLSFQTLSQQAKNNTLEGAGSAVNEFQGQQQVKRSTANKKHTGTHAKETTKRKVSKENGDYKKYQKKTTGSNQQNESQNNEILTAGNKGGPKGKAKL